MLSKLCKRNGVSVPKLYLNIGQGVRGHVRVYGCLRVYVYAALCVLVYVKNRGANWKLHGHQINISIALRRRV